MTRIDIFKMVMRHAMKVGFYKGSITEAQLDTIKTNERFESVYEIKYMLGLNQIAALYMKDLIAYCGGVNIGNIHISMNHHRQKLSTLIFITELINIARAYKGLIFTTHNSSQNVWCDYVTKFVSSSWTNVNIQEIVNANTSNSIKCTSFDSYRLAIEFKKLRYDGPERAERIIQTYLNTLMPIPKEESKPITDAANTANTNFTDKPVKSSTLRTSKVR